MAIAPKMLAAFAGKKKPKNQIEEDDDADEDKAEADAEGDEEESDAAEDEKAGNDPEDDEEGEAHDEAGDDIDVDAIGEQVQNGEWPDKDLINRAKNVDDESNPPSWALDEDIWEKAKAAVEDKWDEYDEPFAVVSAVYQKMGGEIE